MNSTQLSVPILDGKKYNRWCVQMRVLFDYHELWDVIESGVSALAANAIEAQRVALRDKKKKDNKTLYLIHQGMNDETFEQIEGATTASEAWAILSTNYKGDDKIKRVHLQTLRCQYELLQMETTETVDVYINKVLALTNQMKTNGETHLEQAKVEKILRSLTPKFEYVVAAIEEANDISKMTVRLLFGSLRAHEQRMNDNKIEKPIEQTLQAQASIGSSYHKHGSYSRKGRGGQNHGGALRGERGRIGRGDIYNKLNGECYNCHKRGHYANECKSKGDNHASNCAQEDSNHEQDEENHEVLMTTTSNETPNNQTWYLDTGCTNHMCGQKELFSYLDDSFRTKSEIW